MELHSVKAQQICAQWNWVQWSCAQRNCIQWSCVQQSCDQTQIFIPLILFLAEKWWSKKILWKEKFGFNLRLCEVRLFKVMSIIEKCDVCSCDTFFKPPFLVTKLLRGWWFGFSLRLFEVGQMLLFNTTILINLLAAIDFRSLCIGYISLDTYHLQQ